MRREGVQVLLLALLLAGLSLSLLLALNATGQAQAVMGGVPLPQRGPLGTISTTLTYSAYLPLVARNYYPYQPDFVITHVSFDSPVIVAGQPFLFSVTVYNRGAGDSAHGEAPAWFIVEVYFKERAFTPAGAPGNALDHAGGFCSDGSPNCEMGTQRPAHVAFVGGLASRASATAVFNLTFPHSELYDLYVQVDTTWTATGYTGQPWGQHQEEHENNNIFVIADVFVPATR